MAVKIRLSRIGKKKAPSYRIVAVDSRKKRDGAFLENLGTYDALASNIMVLHQERIDYWLGQGAQVSDTVKKLLKLSKKTAFEEAESVTKTKKPKISTKVKESVEKLEYGSESSESKVKVKEAKTEVQKEESKKEKIKKEAPKV